jgi:salicylate hydroxylase
MAIEDAAALGVLLSGVKSKDAIAERLQQFEQLRLKRVAAMVIFSSVGQDEAHKIKDIVRPFVDGPLPSE